MSFFDQVPTAPDDSIFSLTTSYERDTFPKKLNLGVGAYRTAEAQPYVLNVVNKTESILLNRHEDKEYLPIDGYQPFLKAAVTLVLGAQSPAIQEGRACAVQTVGGTGAVRLVADFIKKYFPKDTTVYIPDPTWGNHSNVLREAGVPFKSYRYYHSLRNRLDIAGLLEDLRKAPKRSVILLHACAHNPTGVDPTMEQWETIMSCITERDHLAFFDNAYQGFASGNMEHDAAAVRLFVDNGKQCFVAQSFSKNLGFYSERLGCLTAVTGTHEEASAVKSQLKCIIRASYSNPPSHGARVAAQIMTTPTLFTEWEGELRMMSSRLSDMRQALYEALVSNNTPGDWSHLQTQIGMFTYLGLNKSQVEKLVDQYHIYMTSNGRVSVAGLSPVTVPYLANAIKEVVVSTTTDSKL